MTKDQEKTVSDARAYIATLVQNLEAVSDELSDKFDAMSEKAQEGDKGQELSGQMEALADAVDSLNDVETKLSEVLGE